MKRVKPFLAAGLVASVLFIRQDLALAMTLRESLAQTYANNAQLNIARAKLRSNALNIGLAYSRFLPKASMGSEISYNWPAHHSSYDKTGGVQFQIAQNVFDGFQSTNNLLATKAQIKAQEAQLRNNEQNQLMQAVSAYTNVYMTRRILQLRQQNLRALEEQVKASQARMRVGAGTRTDLAQAEAARARARADYSQAQAEVKAAEAVYQQIVGVMPGPLEKAQMAKDLPESFDQAFAIAIAQHPEVIAGRYQLDASNYQVNVQMGALLPKIDVVASTSYNKVFKMDSPVPIPDPAWTKGVGVRFSMPVFTGGANAIAVRKAQHELASARIAQSAYEEDVRRALQVSWAQMAGLQAAMKGSKDSVRAASIALEGRIQENRVGQATMLDVLNSRSQLIDAEIALARIERSLVLASYNIKAAIGYMTGEKLGFTPPSN